jgi:pimeloyl-ACP methyl ester carboxylesterase
MLAKSILGVLVAKTVLFVHGAWVTPACWKSFISRYEAQGYHCIAPAWPYLDKPVSELKSHVDPRLADQTIDMLVEHYARKIRELSEPPILVGHSFGGLIVQLLLDRGLGSCGVAIDAGPPSGVLPSLPALKAALPVLLTWRGWSKLHTMSFKAFSETFANTLPSSELRKTYDEQIVPAPGRIYFQAAIGIGNSLTFANPARPPLLLITGEKDVTSTPSMVRAMYKKHMRSPRPVTLMEFAGRSHWIIAEPGWEEVAEKALQWAEQLR